MKKYLALWLALLCLCSLVACTEDEAEDALSAKPVIYLYPEESTEVSVQLALDGQLTCVYPDYNDGWTVTAEPDGTLHTAEGEEYYCLYWEGISRSDFDFSQGFCVKGEDSADFLDEALSRLGLTRREANEFIIYWLPQLEANPYNLIAFQTEEYTNDAVLTIEPQPDTLIRVFMAWQPLNEAVDIEAQKLSAPTREGFVAVEWGGAKVKGGEQ